MCVSFRQAYAFLHTSFRHIIFGLNPANSQPFSWSNVIFKSLSVIKLKPTNNAFLLFRFCHSMTSSPEFLLNKVVYNAGFGRCFIHSACECGAIAWVSIVLSPLRAGTSLFSLREVRPRATGQITGLLLRENRFHWKQHSGFGPRAVIVLNPSHFLSVFPSNFSYCLRRTCLLRLW